MAGFNYPSFKAAASGLIEKLGRPAILRADNGAETAVTALIIDYGAAERDGALVQHDDRRAFIVAGPGVIPNPEIHTLIDSGRRHRIVMARAVKPGSTTLYFDCQVRASS
jgi:hypothetical protein